MSTLAATSLYCYLIHVLMIYSTFSIVHKNLRLIFLMSLSLLMTRVQSDNWIAFNNASRIRM